MNSQFKNYDEAREALQQGKLQVNQGTPERPYWIDVPKEHLVFFGRNLEDYRVALPKLKDCGATVLILRQDPATGIVTTHSFIDPAAAANFLWGLDTDYVRVFKHMPLRSHNITDVEKQIAE